MTLPAIIALAGRQEAGKTTIANYLMERHGYAGSAITDPMDEMAAPLLRRMKVAEHEIGPRLTGAMKNVPIPGYEWLTGRRIKQAIGLQLRDALGRPGPDGAPTRTLFQDLWMDDNAHHARIVHQSVRYPFEAEDMRARGAFVVMVVDPNAALNDAHESERMDFAVDAVIENPKTGTESLFRRIDAMLETWKAAPRPDADDGGENDADDIAATDPLTSFEEGIDQAINIHGPEIRAYADRLDADDNELSEIVDDLCADIKTSLGAAAANHTSDENAEAAIEAVSRRITETVTNSTSDRRIAAVFAQFGADVARASLDGAT